MIFKLGLVSLLFILFHVSAAMGSPVISVDGNISEEDFDSIAYTNPDSLEAHDMAANEDGEYSQIRIHDELIPRETFSPDGNFTVAMKAVSTGSDMGIEDYVITNELTGSETKIPGVATMGYYAVAFSPDSKMYAAPMIVSCDDGRNCQYAIDIVSTETNELLHREFTPFYKENTKYTPMEWDLSVIYGIYWSWDGSTIVYEVLGADINGGTYPTTLTMNQLNVNYTQLREMNGYVDPMAEFTEAVNESEDQALDNLSTGQEEENTSTDDTEAVATPGFETLLAVAALFAVRKWKGGKP
ncbi:hypothetical protein V7O62_09450 [Methanolobus sp. ZRKC2]|uniref:hypothetical protein n=1 Tax=Methanolobus sp. ZRKC2 TaxID=3125783 RepID=UPI003247A853